MALTINASSQRQRENVPLTIVFRFISIMCSSWRRESYAILWRRLKSPLTINRLVKEAAIHSKQSGERGLAARSVKKVTRVRCCNILKRVTKSSQIDIGCFDQIQRLSGISPRNSVMGSSSIRGAPAYIHAHLGPLLLTTGRHRPTSMVYPNRYS